MLCRTVAPYRLGTRLNQIALGLSLLISGGCLSSRPSTDSRFHPSAVERSRLGSSYLNQQLVFPAAVAGRFSVMIQGRALTKLMGSFIFSEDLVRIDIFDPTGQAILSLQSDRDWLHWWDLQIGQWYSCPVQGPSVTSFPPILSGPVLLGRCRADEMPQTNAADVTLAKRMITLMWTPKRDCCPDLVRWQIDPSGRIVQRAWLCGEGAQFDISFNYDNRRSRWPRQIILSQWGRPGLKLDITELIERDAPPAKTVRLPVPESPVIITWDDFWASLTTEEPNKWTSSDQ